MSDYWQLNNLVKPRSRLPCVDSNRPWLSRAVQPEPAVLPATPTHGVFEPVTEDEQVDEEVAGELRARRALDQHLVRDFEAEELHYAQLAASQSPPLPPNGIWRPDTDDEEFAERVEREIAERRRRGSPGLDLPVAHSTPSKKPRYSPYFTGNFSSLLLLRARVHILHIGSNLSSLKNNKVRARALQPLQSLPRPSVKRSSFISCWGSRSVGTCWPGPWIWPPPPFRLKTPDASAASCAVPALCPTTALCQAAGRVFRPLPAPSGVTAPAPPRSWITAMTVLTALGPLFMLMLMLFLPLLWPTIMMNDSCSVPRTLCLSRPIPMRIAKSPTP